MKPFDLEAVSKGAEFESIGGQACKFGGFSPDGKRVCFWVKSLFDYDEWWEVVGKSDHSWNQLFRMKPRKNKKEVWVNVYPDGDLLFAYTSKEEADNGACGRRVACIPVTLEWTE